MHAISIKKPWADHILFDGKDIENRTWRLPRRMYGKRVYIHAGKIPDGHYNGDNDRLVAILGEIILLGGTDHSDSEWFCGPYAWILSNPIAYQTPKPAKGRLGFFIPEFV